MSHQLQILARSAPGSLERILRTVRVRGFELSGMSLELDEARGRYHLHLRLRGERPLGLLERQLEKLPDVEQLLALHPGAREEARGGRLG